MTELLFLFVLGCLFLHSLHLHCLFLYVCKERDRLREKVDRLEQEAQDFDEMNELCS